MNALKLNNCRKIKRLYQIFLMLSALGILSKPAISQSLHKDDLGNIKIIDIHVHPPSLNDKNLTTDSLDKHAKKFITAMDKSGVSKTVLLCSGYGNKSPNQAHATSEKIAFHFLKAHSERIVVFTTVDFSRMNSPDFTIKAVEHLEKTVREGARGLKLELGKPLLHWMPMDDPRLDPIYDKAAELGIPIMYHTNDPEDFFYPVNQFNNWGIQLKSGSETGYWGKQDKFVSREQLLHELENMLHKHPNTTFILAHMGFLQRQLPLLADFFDRYPNVYGDLSVTIEDFARSPQESAAFITYYSHRIMFGTDAVSGYPGVAFMNKHFAILETDRDDLPTPRKKAWDKVHGLNLSKEVLERVYYKNAEELLARPVHLPPAR